MNQQKKLTVCMSLALTMLLALPVVTIAQTGLVYDTENIEGSEFPVTYHLVATDDGLYTPIGLRKPEGQGPFPVVLFASGNGGEGLEYIKYHSHNRGWTLDQFLNAGYAVAWLRYRAEVDVPAYNGVALAARPGSGRARFDRAPLEYEDVIATVKYVKSLSFVDEARVGFFGMSHGGEMLMKIAGEYDGIAAGIASEPASASFLARRRSDSATAATLPETSTAHDGEVVAAAVQALHGRIDRSVAMPRLERIQMPIFVQGRDRDHNQDVFRVNYELLVEAGKDVRWKTYDHELHGFAYVERDPDGIYRPDRLQREVVTDSIAFFDDYLKLR